MQSLPIRYIEKNFIFINDISRSLFYFFDFDERSSQINMEFEHFHSFYEIHILLSADAVHFIKGVPYHIQSNDIVLLPPSLLHKTSYPKGIPSKRLIINFMYREDDFGFSQAYEKLFAPFHNQLPIYRLPEKKLQVLIHLLNRITDISLTTASQELTGVEELAVHSIFTEFLYYLHIYQDSNMYIKEAVADKTSESIYTVSNYIHTHYQEELTLNELAKEVYMSPYYLSHQFRQITGYTLTHYIHLTRVRNCQYLLSNTALKITDIASQCGFSSFSQFNRIFRRLCGESPSEYRKKHRSIDFSATTSNTR